MTKSFLKGKEMRKFLHVSMFMFAILGLVMIGCGGKEGDKPAAGGGDQKKEPEKAEKPDVAQAEPVWALFVAVRDNKIDDFKKVWTKERVAELEKDGWDGAFKEFGGDVKKLLGEGFKLAEFKFTYEGDDKKGRVMGTFKDQKLPKMNVEFQDGKWMVSEH